MTDLAESCADLAHLIPRLAPALTRDNTPADGRHGVLSAGTVVNPDVLHAMLTLASQIPATRGRASALTGEPCPRRPALTCLRALPRLHDRLTDLNQAAAAHRIEADIARWTRLVKLALGLRTRDIVLDLNCPYCGNGYPLIVGGSEAFTTPSQVLVWQYDGRIWCPSCRATWPSSQWHLLGRMLMIA